MSAMVKFVEGVVLGAAARACSALGVLFWSSPPRQVAESLIAGLDRAGCYPLARRSRALGLDDFRDFGGAPVPKWSNQTVPRSRPA